MQNVIGLFGTCDGSQWRVPVIERLDRESIEWYNPDAGDNWEPWMADEENRQLKEAHIILFPVLEESLGYGSLGEIGFSILNIRDNIVAGSNQCLIVFIADACADERKTPEQRKDSDRARKLVKSKLAAVTHTNVYLVESIDDMVELAIAKQKVYAMEDEIDATFRGSMSMTA